MDSSKKGWQLGRIKSFDQSKGYGFVLNFEDLKDYFIHISNVVISERCEENDIVVFKLQKSQTKEKELETYLLSEIEDFAANGRGIESLYFKHYDNNRYNINPYIPPSIILECAKKILKNYKQINTKEDYESFVNKVKYLTAGVGEESDIDFHTKIKAIVNKRVPQQYRYNLWIDGISKDEPTHREILEDYFTLSESLKIQILNKASEELKVKLLNKILTKYEISSTIDFLLESKNFKKHPHRKNKLFNKEFWIEKVGKKFALRIEKFKNDLPNEVKMEFFFIGYLEEFPTDYFLENYSELNQSEIEKVFEAQQLSSENLYEILTSLLYPEDLEDKKSPKNHVFWLYKQAKHLSDEWFEKFDGYITDEISSLWHYELWDQYHSNITPVDYLSDLFLTERDKFNKINIWLINDRITKNELNEILLKNIESINIEKREHFYSLYEHIKELLKHKVDLNHIVEKAKSSSKAFINLIAWLEGDSLRFNFSGFSQRFIYLNSNDQIKFIKKLFHLSHKDKFNLSVSHLNELVTIDYNLYSLSQKHNPEVPLDISAHVVIEAIKSFNETGKFLVDSDLLKVVLENLKYDETYKFKIHGLFEKCKGRQIADFDWKGQEGKVKKIPFGDNAFYFAIKLSPGQERRRSNRWGSDSVWFEKNPKFDELKEKIKKLPGRKWNPEEEHWGVPSKFEQQVLEFARENSFFLNFEGSHYENNGHLANFVRVEVPKGIQYCEGRLAKKKHKTHNKPFWWCCNDVCHSNCETFHTPEEWESYSLLDFLTILGFDLDDGNRVGDYVERGKYYQFISTINRFNKLLSHLYCNNCNHILYPIDDSHFAHYRVTRFWCENEECGEHHKEIYLHHCLNGKCNGIIDSRISEKCPNGLYICSNEDCGCCCSHSQFFRRLNNLKKTGNFHNQSLENAVTKKLGHKEKAVHYCYECGKKMEEFSHEQFKCASCNIKYDLRKNNFKRPHRHLAKE